MDARPLSIFQRYPWNKIKWANCSTHANCLSFTLSLCNSGKKNHVKRERGGCFLNISKFSIRSQICTSFWGKSTRYFAQEVRIMILEIPSIDPQIRNLFHFIINYRTMIRFRNNRFLFNLVKIACSKPHFKSYIIYM